MIPTQISPVHATNLVTNHANTTYGVEIIARLWPINHTAFEIKKKDKLLIIEIMPLFCNEIFYVWPS